MDYFIQALNECGKFCSNFCCFFEIDTEEYYRNRGSGEYDYNDNNQYHHGRRRSPRIHPIVQEVDKEQLGGLDQSEIREYKIRKLDVVLHEDCTTFFNSSFFTEHVKFLQRGFEDESAQCVICLSEFELDDSQLLILPCSHIFHRECCTKWFEQKYKEFQNTLSSHKEDEVIISHGVKCPVCRYELSLSNRTKIEQKRIDRMKELFTEKGFKLLILLNRFQHVFILVMNSYQGSHEKMGMREKVEIMKNSNGELLSIMMGLDSLEFDTSVEIERKNRKKRKSIIVQIQKLQAFVDEKLRNITVVY